MSSTSTSASASQPAGQKEETRSSGKTAREALDAAERKASKSSAREETPGGQSARALNGAFGAGEDFWDRSLSFSSEAARFAARRAERYREYFDDLARCRNPVEASQAAARAMQAAMRDYAEEYGRLGEMTLSGIEKAEREAGLSAD